MLAISIEGQIESLIVVACVGAVSLRLIMCNQILRRE